MDPISQSLLEHYQSGRPLTGGRVGSLTEEEVRKLRELWRLLLAELDADAPLPVVYGTAADPGPDDVASLSFEPLQALSTKDREGGTGASTPAAEATPAASETASGASTPRKELRSGGGGGGGWLGGWWSAPASGRSTPAEDSEDNERRRMETVQGHLTRTRGDGPVVPAEFRPLFGGSAGARSARAVFWQAAAQMADADSWVLRFLRARKWDVEQAMGMVRKTLQWRAGQAIDETVYFGEARLHHHTLDSGLAFACTVDRLGSPVFIVRVRVNVARNRTVQAIKRMLCWQIETSQLLATGPSDGRVTILFDLSDFTRENIDTRLVRTLITLLTNYYPETLGVVLVYVNSLLFGALWALIAPFIDPV
ncbi:phosphatidylinositol transfer protein csr1, partial [Coemansia nantahalensis]